MLNTAIWGASAAAVGLLVSFVVLKLMGEKDILNHKLFPFLMAGGMLLVYVARAYIRTA